MTVVCAVFLGRRYTAICRMRCPLKTFKSLTDLKTEDIRPDSHFLGTRQLYERSSLF